MKEKERKAVNAERNGAGMELTAAQEIIVALKKVQAKDKLSISDIYKRVAATGTIVSESVLRRIFKDGSEANDSFNYERTLRPLSQALLLSGTDDDSVFQVRLEGLEANFRLKNERIAELEAQIAELKDAHEKRCREYEKRLDFLRDQIEKKDQRMDRKDDIIQRLMDKVL